MGGKRVRRRGEGRCLPCLTVVALLRRNCWICERWREVKFTYKPGVSGPPGNRVCLHADFDKWKADVMDFVSDAEGDDEAEEKKQGEFVLYRMVPPGNVGPSALLLQRCCAHQRACNASLPVQETTFICLRLTGRPSMPLINIMKHGEAQWFC